MSNSTKKKMQKYPAQYFLQKKVNEVLFEKKSKITTVSILREGVKDNLKKFRAYFQTHFPVTDHPKDIIKRNNEIATIKGKYIFDVYFRHITETNETFSEPVFPSLRRHYKSDSSSL